MNSCLWADHSVARVDAEGRHLNEQAAAGYAADGEVLCPYADRRQGGTMNRAALEQVQRHWGAVLARVERACPPRATLQQAFQVALEAVCEPLLAPDGPVPVAQAATYKACVGFCQVFAWLLLSDDQAGQQPLADWGDGSEFFDFLDSHGWLMGAGQVCAGSRGQIASLYGVFCNGQGPNPPLTKVLEAVALQSALVLATYQSMREGVKAQGSLGHRLLTKGSAPWLYAVTARPEGQPDWARRLLPPGAFSPTLDLFLTRSEALCHGEREALARELFARL